MAENGKSPLLRFADFKTKRAQLQQDFLQSPVVLRAGDKGITQKRTGARLAVKTSQSTLAFCFNRRVGILQNVREKRICLMNGVNKGCLFALCAPYLC